MKSSAKVRMLSNCSCHLYNSNIVKCSEKYIQLPHPLCVTVTTRFGEKLLAHFRRKKVRLYLMIQPTLRKLLKEKWQVFST